MAHMNDSVTKGLSEVIDRVNLARGGCTRLVELLAPTAGAGYAHMNVSEAMGLLERANRLLNAAWLEQGMKSDPGRVG